MKIIYVNCRVKNYLKEDHHSYIHNLIMTMKLWIYQLSKQANCEQVVEFRSSSPIHAWIFFSCFLFATAQVAYITAMIFLWTNNSSLRRLHIGFSYIHNFSIEQIKHSLFNCLVRWNKQVWYSLSSRAFNLATALSKLTKINPSIFLDKSRSKGLCSQGRKNQTVTLN